ncbi:hypothetical protein G6F37_010846 [Rhizopus arrhizus]|nr:hypothetical protein G6F38_003460 [Rhizopus arrhizus]KAG1152158.1 hypothetical protein G6F37_010846 [Rhizopus arrhizus]
MSNNNQLTILRIKRKRTEEPLDALLLHQENEEKRLKKNNENKSVLKVSATALPTVFRLAETVEEASFSNLDEAKKLKDRIARRIQPGTSRPQTPVSREERKEQLMQKQSDVSKKARYRVINQNRSKTVEQNAPPVVQSSAEKAAQDLFQMFEAVREDETNNNNKQPKLFVDEDADDVDDIMCNFIPMIKEYLTLNEKEPEDDDYVYDVYYREEHNPVVNTSNVGSLVWFDGATEYMDDNDTDSEIGDVEDEDSNAEDYYQNDYPEEEDGDDHDEFEDRKIWLWSIFGR